MPLLNRFKRPLQAILLCLIAPVSAAPAWAQLGPLPGIPLKSLNQPNGPAALDSTGTVGGLVLLGRTLAARAQDRINLKDAPYNARGDGVTDDSAALAAAMSAMLSRNAAGSYPCIYAPAGTYLVAANTTPLMTGPGCILGDGPRKTMFKLSASYSGDLFAFSEDWLLNTVPFNGTAPVLTGQTANPVLRDFSIAGDRTTTNTQNAIIFYDRNDFVTIDNVYVEYVKGRGLASGLTKNQTQAYMRESRITNTRFFNDGAAGIPVVEWNSAGGANSDATNEIDIEAMRIYAPYGPGFVVRNGGQGTVRSMRINKLSIEGLESNPAGITANLLTIGDPVMTGIVNSLNFRAVELLDPYAGYASLYVGAPSSVAQPYQIDVQGFIGGGAAAGKGLNIQAGRNMRFDFTDINTTDTNVTVGATPTVGSQIEINGPAGRENSWTWNVDPSAFNSLLSAPLRTGNPGSPVTLGFTLGLHDGSATGGNAAGTGAIDLQAQRNNNSQVASGGGAVLLGGSYNTANASQAAIVGSGSSTACGVSGFIAGSSGASDRCRYGSWAYGFGTLNGQGSAQSGRQTMMATGTAAMRLTSAAAAANSTFLPIFNIPANAAFNLAIRLSAIDRTAPANSYAWTLPMALMSRGAAASSTALALGTATALSTGTGSGATVSATADTANGGLNLTFTPPSGADTWDVFADIWSAEVQ